LGSLVTAELLEGITGTTPLFRGRVYYLGQIGSIVRIPHGTIDLLGTVTMVGIAEVVGPQTPASMPTQGDRWIQFQLLGELDATGKFGRGVSAYPSMDDSVHFATIEILRAIYPSPGGQWIHIGSLSSMTSEAIAIDSSRLVMRHSAIVGSTGAGKSSAVARIIQSLISSGYRRANIVVIDPHGEYSAALGNWASVHKVVGEGSSLSIPYWALGLDDTIRVFARPNERAETKQRIQELMTQLRREFLGNAKWPNLDVADVSADSPTPYDIRKLWYLMDFENNATYPKVGDQGDACVEGEGSATDLAPARFKSYGQGGAAPFKGKRHGAWQTLPEKIRNRLLDPRFQFLRREWPDAASPDPLVPVLQQWLGGDRPVSVLDLSGAASEAADVAIGVILSLLFELAVASTSDKGIGRGRPVLIVLEEAHRYLGKNASPAANLACIAAEQIAREGRKYGVGMMAVSQRPAELSDVVLSQVGTIMSLRLTNSIDQSTIRSALPDAVANIAESLPALRTGEALITGEAIPLPSRCMLDRPDPPPQADDPTLKSWLGAESPNDLDAAVANWRSRSAG
jgi:hypothetical protein